jgi:hypothetical protein
VVLLPIIRSAYNCIYSIWYCHTVTAICRYRGRVGTGFNSSTKAADSSNGVTIPDAVDTVVCAPDYGWKYHPKHVEQFSDINKLCNVASCWIHDYIGILLGAHPILHISRIKVKIGGSVHSLSLSLSVVSYPTNSYIFWLLFP